MPNSFASLISEDIVINGDLSADRQIIVYLDKNSNLKYVHNDQISLLSKTSNAIQGNVKFYPNGHELISFSNFRDGIELWDIINKISIYKYNIRGLYLQSYSPKGLLCSSSEYNLKFFDLKVRYSIFSRKFLNAKFIEWKNEHIFYVIDDLGISEFDIRSLKNRKSFTECGFIKCFKVLDDEMFFIKKEKKKNYLVRMKNDMVQKECIGTSLTVIDKKKLVFCVPNKDCIDFFTLKNNWRINFEKTGTIKDVKYCESENKFIMFSDQGIYKFYYKVC